MLAYAAMLIAAMLACAGTGAVALAVTAMEDIDHALRTLRTDNANPPASAGKESHA